MLRCKVGGLAGGWIGGRALDQFLSNFKVLGVRVGIKCLRSSGAWDQRSKV